MLSWLIAVLTLVIELGFGIFGFVIEFIKNSCHYSNNSTNNLYKITLISSGALSLCIDVLTFYSIILKYFDTVIVGLGATSIFNIIFCLISIFVLCNEFDKIVCYQGTIVMITNSVIIWCLTTMKLYCKDDKKETPSVGKARG